MSVRKGGQIIAGSVDTDKYAKTDLSNLNETVQAKLDAKANTDFSNCNLSTVHCVVETYKSGSSWYRVYDDGWVEQGGETASVAGGSSTGVTFLKPFSSADYTINSCPIGNYTASGEANNPIKKTKTGFTQYCGQISACPFDWMACGYGA